MFDLIREAAPRGLDRFFSDYLGGFPWGSNGAASVTFPPLDLWEDEKAVHVKADVPGLKLEDIDVSVLDNELSIRGERKEQPAEGATVLRRERGAGSFVRTVILSTPIDAARVQATMEDGVLTVILPKSED